MNVVPHLSPSSFGRSEQEEDSSSQARVGLRESGSVCWLCSPPHRISCLRMAGSYGLMSNFKCTCSSHNHTFVNMGSFRTFNVWHLHVWMQRKGQMIIRARAPNGERPYWNCKDFFFFPRQKKGLLHAQKVSKLGRELESGENVRILEYLKKGVAKWLNSATWSAAHGALWKSQQEARHFAFSGHFGHIPHFYFDVLVPGLSSDQLLIKMSLITTTWTYKLTERSIFRHTVWPWRGVKVWLNAMKTQGSVSRT